MEYIFKARQDIVMYTTVANFFYVAWLVGFVFQGHAPSAPFLVIAAWVPFLLTLLSRSLLANYRNASARIAAYVRLLEDTWGNKNLGYEHYVDKERGVPLEKTHSTSARVLLFQLILAGALGIYITWIQDGPLVVSWVTTIFARR